ncbi:MAG: Rne/Rng family ribonuclease [Pseudorhodobacter sp.]|nr:Rne/Rng family ribonuclease [Rhizobacter sp.]
MKRMLINATQPEERRLAIVDGQKLLDFETEIEGREQRKGNIYKAVVTRVEPSLEACFVDYGEDRHGFLPFKEISRNYFREGVDVRTARIQDAIKDGDQLLVQVEKEERGNKGAALTTMVSLAGRYLVLMPNNPRGGGVSRRIEGEEREELKENLDQLEYPKGMSLIARTAGIGRSAPELQWDLNYMLKLWDAIDGASKAGKGAFLIYQESSLVIRAIRDYFTADVGEILIDTDDIFEQAQQFMSHVMPETAHKVKRYRDDAPLFSRFQIEHQIETAFSRTVNLPSGGAIVIDHTEALVSVDVNSARSTRGSDIEETATRTNLEAADEIARQMRLRDLAGLIVVDFIDMEESKNRREVETRLRDALRPDRARVQFSTISKFGLLEMSRQRLRPALSEGSHITCPRCNGTGHIRDTESSALQILRMVQEESMKDNTAAVHVQVPVEVTSFLLNEKRTEITKIEMKQRVTVLLVPNKNLDTPNYRLERLRHDDPRLENLQASYTMIEEAEEESGPTRREKTAPKQQPVIKGILPETPAPAAIPKPAPVVAAPVAAPAPVHAPAPASSGGFFGWLGRLFGGGDSASGSAPTAVKTAAATSSAATAAAATLAAASESRGDRAGRGGRGGRDSKRGEGRGEGRGENRSDRGERTDKTPASGEGRGRGERSERGERGGRGGRGERADKPEEGSSSEASTSRLDERGPKPESRVETRGEVRGEARGDGRRGSRNPRPADTEEATAVDAAQQQSFIDTLPGAEGTANAENGEAREGSRRRRRGRGGRDRDESQTGEVGTEGHGEANADDVPATSTGEAGSDAPVSEEGAPRAEGSEGGERERGRRGRGRNRRERGAEDASPSAEAATYDVNAAEPTPISSFAPAAVATDMATPTAMGGVRDLAADAEEAVPAVVIEPVAVPVVALAPTFTPAPAPAVAVAAAPAAPFVLQVNHLSTVAETAGLQWVNSDASKIKAAQEAMAREPSPVRVPREIKAPAPVSDSALVMVETRKDLSQIKLPFEISETSDKPAV